MSDLERFIQPETLNVIKAAGLHRVVGEIKGVGPLHMGKVAALIGSRAYILRKTAGMIGAGLVSTAAVTGQVPSPESMSRLRGMFGGRGPR